MFRKTDAPKRARSPEQAADQAVTTPLHTAAIAGDLEGVKRILRNRNRGYSVEAVDKDGHTAVWHAISAGHTAVAKTLVNNKFCPCALPTDLRDDYQVLLTGEELRHEEEEWQKLVNTPVDFEFEFTEAKPASDKKLKAENVAATNLFQQPAPVAPTFVRLSAAPLAFGKTTYLHLAVSLDGVTPSQQQRRLLRVKQELMNPDINVDAVNEHGYTALYIASVLGRTDEMIAILERGANKHFVSQNPNVDSPYKWVSERGSDKMKEIMGVVQQHGLRK